MPEQELIIRHICVEGWDYIGQWSGPNLRSFLTRIGADPTAKYVYFICNDDFTESIDTPTLLLLHGFPTSSHMFRELIPLLSGRFHVVAPDLPGFGQSDMPARELFTYTFAHLAEVIGRFTEMVGLRRFAIYIFDYGAPLGLRIAIKHPERITAIISQNGNAYDEGLSDGWNPIRTYWREPTSANRDALRSFL